MIKSKILSLCIFVLMFSSANFANAEAKPVRIAIVGDTAKYKAEVDLLVAELSKDDSLALLERERIDLILKEHKIALSDISKNSLQLGKLLGADGVLILRELKYEGKTYLSTRLVAVKPATIIDVFVIPAGKKSEKFNWVETARWHFKPLFRKLNVSKEEAIPISLLSFRAQSDAPETLAVEKQINLLFSHRLMKEKNVFVNERWSLGQVFFETELEKQFKKEFWTGSMVIEGTFELKGDQIEAQLILNGKDDSKSEKIKFTGKKGKLPQLVEKMSRVIVEKVGKEVSGSWDIKEEAEKYFKEAQWAYNCGLYKNAQQAADASWALGKKTPEVLILKIKTYGGKELVTRSFSRKLAVNYLNISKISEPEKYLDDFIYALQIYKQLCTENPAKHKTMFTDPPTLIRFASAILHSSYKEKLHLDKKYHDKLMLLSKLTGESFEISVNSECNYWQRNAYSTLFYYYSPFWYKNTDELTEKYLKYFVEDRMTDFDNTRIDHRAGSGIPWVVNWESEDLDEEGRKWIDFIKSLILSKNLIYQIDGLILRKYVTLYNNEIKDKEIEVPANFANELLWENRNLIFDQKKGKRLKSLCYLGVLSSSKRKESYSVDNDYFLKFLKFFMEKGKHPDWGFLNYLYYQNRNKDFDPIFKELDKYAKKNPGDRHIEFKRLVEKLCKDSDRPIPDYFTSDFFLPDLKLKINPTHTFDLNSLTDEEFFGSFALEKGSQKGKIILQADDLRKKEEVDGYFFIIYDMAAKTHELIVFPENLLEKKRSSYFPNRMVFFNGEPDNYLWVVHRDGKIFNYSKKKNRWELKKDLKEKIQASVLIENSLYLGLGLAVSGGGRKRNLGGKILNYNIKSGKLDSIASYRRNPPLTPLDNIGYFGIHSFRMTKDGNLLALILSNEKEAYFLYDTEKKSWKQLSDFKRLWNTNQGFLNYNRSKKDFSWDSEILFVYPDKKSLRFKDIFNRYHPYSIYSIGKSLYFIKKYSKEYIITRLDTDANLTKSVGLNVSEFDFPSGRFFTDKNVILLYRTRKLSIISWKSINDHLAKKLYTPDIFPNEIMEKDKDYQKASFSDECIVSLKAHDDGASIYYSLDGSTPSKESRCYSKPFKIDKTTIVKTVAIKEGFIPSDIRCITFMKRN